MSTLNQTVALVGPIGMPEMIVLGLLGVLIFGKRLPEVGRSMGKSFIEFKKGLQDIETEVEQAVPAPAKQIEEQPVRAD